MQSLDPRPKVTVPIKGLLICGLSLTRVLPWAITFRAFGACVAGPKIQ